MTEGHVAGEKKIKILKNPRRREPSVTKNSYPVPFTSCTSTG